MFLPGIIMKFLARDKKGRGGYFFFKMGADFGQDGGPPSLVWTVKCNIGIVSLNFLEEPRMQLLN